MEDLTGHNIDIVCSLLETCGRYLFKNTETHETTQAFLDIILRKQQAHSLDPKYGFMIENALYTCNPPDIPITVTEKKEPIELLLHKLIFQDLSRSNVQDVTTLLRKMPWDDEAVVCKIRKLFLEVWNNKSSNIPLLAFMTGELSEWHPDFAMSIVDRTLEEIRIGIEANIFKHNQRRISIIRYVGELYNYRLIRSSVIFDTLYLLLRFGHSTFYSNRQRHTRS